MLGFFRKIQGDSSDQGPVEATGMGSHYLIENGQVRRTPLEEALRAYARDRQYSGNAAVEANPELADINAQRKLVEYLENNLSEEEKQPIAADLAAASSMVNSNQKLEGQLLAKLSNAQKNKELKEMLGAAGEAALAAAKPTCVLCCQRASGADYCTPLLGNGLGGLFDSVMAAARREPMVSVTKA